MEMLSRKRFFAAALSMVVFPLFGCGSFIYADGPYHGRVIDAETKQPIEGAAVLAVWSRRAAFLAHPSITYYDAQETLSDKGGNFTIPGTSSFSLNPLSRIDEPRFTIFTPGYRAYTAVFQVSTQDTPTGLYEKDGMLVVELKQLTRKEERLENLGRISISSRVPNEKYPNLMRLRDLEEASLGLSSRQPAKGAGP